MRTSSMAHEITLLEALVQHGGFTAPSDPSWYRELEGAWGVVCSKIDNGRLKIAAISDVKMQQHVEINGRMIWEFRIADLNKGKLLGPGETEFFDARVKNAAEVSAENRAHADQILGFLITALGLDILQGECDLVEQIEKVQRLQDEPENNADLELAKAKTMQEARRQVMESLWKACEDHQRRGSLQVYKFSDVGANKQYEYLDPVDRVLISLIPPANWPTPGRFERLIQEEFWKQAELKIPVGKDNPDDPKESVPATTTIEGHIKKWRPLIFERLVAARRKKSR